MRTSITLQIYELMGVTIETNQAAVVAKVDGIFQVLLLRLLLHLLLILLIVLLTSELLLGYHALYKTLVRKWIFSSQRMVDPCDFPQKANIGWSLRNPTLVCTVDI